MDQDTRNCPPGFVKLATIDGDKYFRKDDIKLFGILPNRNADEHPKMEITLQTSEHTSDLFTYLLPGLKAFDNFLRGMGCGEKAATGVDGQTQDTRKYQLKFANGTREFYSWLYSIFFNSKSVAKRWTIKPVDTADQKFLQCHYDPGNPTEEYDLFIRFSSDLKSAMVSTITSSCFLPVDTSKYNTILDLFVREVLPVHASNNTGFRFEYQT